MAIKNLTAETFEAAIEHGIVLVDLWAAWCGPCRAFAPTFEAASARHPSVVFAKVDTEAEHQLAGELGVQAIPTLMVFRDGVLVFSRPGAIPGPAIDALVARVQALDMDAIRREVADAVGHRAAGTSHG
jgi:thioredoxin 1